jgi:hypothetical protein
VNATHIAGLLLATIPATTPVLRALALLALLGVEVVLFLALYAIAAAMRSSHVLRAERGRMITTEPDPIESYPPTPLNCRQEPPYVGLNTVVMSIRAPSLVAHRASLRCALEVPHTIAECGEFVPLNPLGQSEADVRIRS